MTGYWELKDNLDPLKCLQFGDKDDNGENMIDLDEIVVLRLDPEREVKESDCEHIPKVRGRDGKIKVDS